MPIKVMVMNVAVFDASCSPAQSLFVMNLNATEYEAEYPRAPVLFVDDYLNSVDTDEEAVA